MTTQTDAQTHEIDTQQFFGSVQDFANWLDRNCHLCRFHDSPPPNRPDRTTCPVPPTITAYYFHQCLMTDNVLDILLSSRPPNTRRLIANAPHKCDTFKDRRGRRRPA